MTTGRYAVNLSVLFTELPLLERPAAATDAGFWGIEFWWPFATAVPADREVDAFVRSVEDSGVSSVGLNFFAGDMPGADRGLVSWPGQGCYACLAALGAERRPGIDVVLAVTDFSTELARAALVVTGEGSLEEQTLQGKDAGIEYGLRPHRSRSRHRPVHPGRRPGPRAARAADRPERLAVSPAP